MNRIFELAIEDVNGSQDICEDTIDESIIKIRESVNNLESTCREINDRLKNENTQ
jgi:hypothetical protein